MPIPGKILSRKDEIAAEFMQLVEEHVNDLLLGRFRLTLAVVFGGTMPI